MYNTLINVQLANVDHTSSWSSELTRDGRIHVFTGQGLMVQLVNRLEKRWVGSCVQHEEVDGSIAFAEVVGGIVNQSHPHARPCPRERMQGMQPKRVLGMYLFIRVRAAGSS